MYQVETDPAKIVKWPARSISLRFDHPTCGDGFFTGMVATAVREYHTADSRGELGTYIATNGVVITVTVNEERP